MRESRLPVNHRSVHPNSVCKNQWTRALPVLTRQALPPLDRTKYAAGERCSKGADSVSTAWVVPLRLESVRQPPSGNGSSRSVRLFRVLLRL